MKFGIERNEAKNMHWELQDGFVVDDDEVLSCDEVCGQTLILNLGHTQTKPVSDEGQNVTQSTVYEKRNEVASNSGKLAADYFFHA